MQRLWLDYQRPAPGRLLPGVFLLGFAIAVNAWLAVRYFDATAALDELAPVISKLKRNAERQQLAMGLTGAASRSDTVATAAAERDAPPLMGGTVAGWEKLFGALESAGDESVTLLAIQPQNAEMRLRGEAKNFTSAMDYVSRLQSGTMFGAVVLAQSEVVREHPQLPVRFELSAQWKTQGMGAAP